jgi:hypothetical protein
MATGTTYNIDHFVTLLKTLQSHTQEKQKSIQIEQKSIQLEQTRIQDEKYRILDERRRAQHEKAIAFAKLNDISYVTMNIKILYYELFNNYESIITTQFVEDMLYIYITLNENYTLWVITQVCSYEERYNTCLLDTTKKHISNEEYDYDIPYKLFFTLEDIMFHIQQTIDLSN